MKHASFELLNSGICKKGEMALERAVRFLL